MTTLVNSVIGKYSAYVALVTGNTSHYGLPVTRRFDAESAQVVITIRRLLGPHAAAQSQGSGFVVVAIEVGSLAGRSAAAAKEIKALFNASVERVDRGTTLVDQAGATMAEIVGSIRRVTDLIGEISSASQEQAQGVSQVGAAVTQLDQTTQQNAALVEEEEAAAASSLKGQSYALVQLVGVFRLGAANDVSQRLLA